MYIGCTDVHKLAVMKRKKISIHKELAGMQRKFQKEHGFFDGRFVSRLEESKKRYKRKLKHTNKNYN